MCMFVLSLYSIGSGGYVFFRVTLCCDNMDVWGYYGLGYIYMVSLGCVVVKCLSMIFL